MPSWARATARGAGSSAGAASRAGAGGARAAVVAGVGRGAVTVTGAGAGVAGAGVAGDPARNSQQVFCQAASSPDTGAGHSVGGQQQPGDMSAGALMEHTPAADTALSGPPKIARMRTSADTLRETLWFMTAPYYHADGDGHPPRGI